MNKLKIMWYSIEIKLKNENRIFVFHAMDGSHSVEMKDNIFKLEINGQIVFICAMDSIKYFNVIEELR